jgi:hypothetical protein
MTVPLLLNMIVFKNHGREPKRRFSSFHVSCGSNKLLSPSISLALEGVSMPWHSKRSWQLVCALSLVAVLLAVEPPKKEPE